MNYRHAFHAGNFADLVKHAVLLMLLARRGREPLTVIDTHAGRGLYDLTGPEAQRSGEADAGVGRLIAAQDAPAAFAPLLEAVRRLNGGGKLARYPGSPWLVAESLRPGDRYVACELRGSEQAALKKALAHRPGVETLCADGYATAVQRCPQAGPVLALIDPPFERADDYAHAAETAATLARRNPQARVLIWLPLKDLETFDGFLRDLQDATDAPVLVAQTRMRPLTDPLRMNGCALVLVGDEAGLQAPIEAVCHWTSETLGEGGQARVYAL